MPVRKRLTWISVLSWLSMTASASPARFEPPEGKIILFAGQTATDIPDYLDATQEVPAGLMTYIDIYGAGLDAPYEETGIIHHVRKLVDDYPGTALQIGLYLVDQCEAISLGERDHEIDHLADWLGKSRRPVFLRIGYEFDGPHNHYPPADYSAAYRRIVDRFRAKGVKNVAFVWHSFASTGSRKAMDWYPGDGYVDWVGISYFNQSQSYMRPVLDIAKTLGKPVMIAEATPAGVQTKYANSWNLWFSPMLKFVRENGIRAISMISCEWDKYPQFASQKWGDCRLRRGSPVLPKWIEETRRPEYLKSTPDLFHVLGYAEE